MLSASRLDLAPHWLIPLLMLLMLSASAAVYWQLVRRWTTQRQWLALSDWAEQKGFKLHGEKHALVPTILAEIAQPIPRVLISLNDEDTAIVQVEVQSAALPAEITRPQRWNLLIRKLASNWPATALRPVLHRHSIIDVLSLSSFHSVAPNARFVIYGSDQPSARQLGRSSAMALLPADVGILLIGHNLVLDFSTRPFDNLEFERMDALAEQIVAHLPAVQVSAASAPR